MVCQWKEMANHFFKVPIPPFHTCFLSEMFDKIVQTTVQEWIPSPTSPPPTSSWSLAILVYVHRRHSLVWSKFFSTNFLKSSSPPFFCFFGPSFILRPAVLRWRRTPIKHCGDVVFGWSSPSRQMRSWWENGCTTTDAFSTCLAKVHWVCMYKDDKLVVVRDGVDDFAVTVIWRDVAYHHFKL